MALWTRFVPLFLFLFALAVRVVAMAATRFDGLYGQDPFAYYQYALELRQALTAGHPPPPFFWPIGYPLLVVLAMGVGGPLPLAGQWVSLVAGTAVAPLVYSLARAYQPERYVGSVMAGLLAATAGQLLLSSLSVMADTAALFWATLSAWLLLNYMQRPQLGWWMAAAVTLAFATLTRWVYGLLLIPWAITALLFWQQAGFPWRRMALLAAVAGSLGFGLLILQLAADVDRGQLSYAGDLQVYSWHPANALKREIVNVDGRFTYEYATGVFYTRPAFHPAYIFPLLAPFWLLGLWAIRRTPLPYRVLIIGWLLAMYLFLIGVPWQNWRFPLAFFPPLLVLLALGLDWLWGRLAGGWRWLLLIYCAIAIVGSVVWAIYDIGRFTHWAAKRQETAVIIAAQLPPGATLLAFDLTATLQHYTAVETLELFSLSEADLAEILLAETAVYLLLDPTSIQNQWAGKAPERNFAWLQAHTSLTPLTTAGPYVLYEVEIEELDIGRLDIRD
jgi:4-amino-4-deoxy-L-arabinose transferase-like glycosyltransferase